MIFFVSAVWLCFHVLFKVESTSTVVQVGTDHPHVWRLFVNIGKFLSSIIFAPRGH